MIKFPDQQLVQFFSLLALCDVAPDFRRPDQLSVLVANR